MPKSPADQHRGKHHSHHEHLPPRRHAGLGAARIDSGQYANNSDYVRDLIRRDQQRHDKFRALQAAIDEGLASGIAEDFSLDKLQGELNEDWCTKQAGKLHKT